MKKGMIALIGMVVALVFIIIALVGPWYAISASSPGNTMDSAMSLTSSTTTINGVTQTTSNADARKQSSGDTGIFGIIDITMYLTIFTLVVAILGLVFLLGYSFNFGKPSMMKVLAMTFGIITFVLALVAVFYFMVAVPSETNSTFGVSGLKNVGFWYSTTVTGASISLGPGFAWYLMLVAGIIALISFIFVLMDKRAAPVYQNPAP